MRKALVLNVGAGEREVDGLLIALQGSVRNSNPDRLVLLASEATRANAERVKQELSLAEHATTHILEDEFDYERIFLESMVILRALEGEGFTRTQIDVDFTSGTKAMSAGLALAAVAFGCEQLRYIAVERHDGRPISGTERYIARNPAKIRAHQELRTSLRLFQEMQFGAARRIVTNVNDGLLDEHDRRLRQGVSALVNAYDAWDKFLHGQFNGPYRTVDFQLMELAPFKLADGIATDVQGLHDAPRIQDWRGRITADLLADLWNNANRRKREGKHDDAVARLYRLTEMLAQHRLARKHDIPTADVPLERLTLPDAFREKLERLRRRGKVKIGLQDAYDLLAAGLQDQLGDAFVQAATLQKLLVTRNESILAHGSRPVSADDARALAEEVRKLAMLAVPDFEARAVRLQFPWLATEG